MEAETLVSSRSPWQSLVVLVKNGNGELHVFADLRTLKMYLKPVRFALGLTPDILHRAQGSQYFASIDLKSAYKRSLSIQKAKIF